MRLTAWQSGRQIGLVIFTWCIIHCSVAQAQLPAREQLAGTWIGVNVAYDEQFYWPNPIYMTLGADSTYSFGLIDARSPVRRSSWLIDEQSVRLDTSTYALNQWALSGDELRLTGAFPMTFRRLSGLAVDSATVHRSLVGHSWATDSLTYHFHANGSACLINPKTGDVAMHCWRLAQVGQSTFIVIKGNRFECDGNFQYPLQVTQVSADRLHCAGGSPRPNERLVLTRGTKLASESHGEPKGFQPCRTYGFPSFNLYPYYSYRRGRLFDIRQVVEREYKPIALPGQSGLIRFRFVVNCRGETGQFEVLEVNENYEKRLFDPRIVNQLTDICRTKLPNQEPGRPNGETEPVDTVCLLTFRLKDGLITEIFP